MPWFVKIEEGIVDKITFDRYVPAHKVYVQDLITKGHQARTGYWARMGGGMMIFLANSMEEARKIVDEDPLVKNGCVKYQLYEWRVVVE
ncbi:MAG TPA: YciI family protein [Leptolyngbyaceae cyanobacterium]